MTTEYEINKDDLLAFNLHHHFHSPTARHQYLRTWFVPAFVLLLACAGIWYLADRERGTPLQTFLDLLPLFSSVLIYLIYFPWAYRRKVRKIIEGMVSEGQNRGLFGRHQVEISQDGITESGEFGHASTTWRAVERVVRNDDYAFIYTSALTAIIIPRRAFPVAAEFGEFVKTANSWHEQARSRGN